MLQHKPENNLTQTDIANITRILREYLDVSKHTAFIFGSAAEKKMRRSSDIDLAIEGATLTPQKYFDLQDAFTESNLPYTVDVVAFNQMSDQFKKNAKRNIIPLPLK